MDFYRFVEDLMFALIYFHVFLYSYGELATNINVVLY